MSKIAFIDLENNITPLFALIVLSHTDFSLECLNTPQHLPGNTIDNSLLPAVYCNGSIKLFQLFSKDQVKDSLKNNTYGNLQPIHIVCVYHNYEILEDLIKIGVKIDSISSTWKIFTPQLLVVGNNTQRYGDYAYEESGAIRDEIVQLLLKNGADIRFSNQKGTSSLHIACKMGYNNTEKHILIYQADINSRTVKGASHLSKACKQGNDSTLQLSLKKGTNISLCTEKGASSLYIACQNGQYSIVQHLLNNGATIIFHAGKRTSPLYVAIIEGHDSTVQLLRSNEAYCYCFNDDGAIPLYISFIMRYKSTVQYLMNNAVDLIYVRRKKPVLFI